MLTILLYGAASWVIFRRHLRLIEHYHQRCLRPILNIHWSDFVTNTEVLEVATFTSIEIMPLKTQHRWAGRVSGIEEHRLSTITIYGELATGHRDRGTPRKRYKDTLKRSFATCKVDHRKWTTQSTNRMNWRRTSSFETRWRATMEDKRRRRKTGTLLTPPLNRPCRAGAVGKCLSRMFHQLSAFLHQTWTSSGIFVRAKQSYDNYWAIKSTTKTMCLDLSALGTIQRRRA